MKAIKSIPLTDIVDEVSLLSGWIGINEKINNKWFASASSGKFSRKIETDKWNFKIHKKLWGLRSCVAK